MTLLSMITLPEMLLSTGAILLMIVAAWRGDRAAELNTGIAVALLLAACVLLWGPAPGPRFDGLYIGDSFSAYAKAVIYLMTIVALLVAPRFFAAAGGERLRAEYPVLILFATVGAGIMVSAGDFLSLYLGLELQSLASYTLASMMRRDGRSVEAGLKYFVLGALASGILLYGISLLYGFIGATNFAALHAAMSVRVSTGVAIALAFVFAGLAFKIAAVPFHMWTPDVYEGAPTPVTLLFAGAQKMAAMAMLLRVAYGALAPAFSAWQPIIVFAALASILVGALGAIAQTSLKRMLAYSSINNAGFVLIGVATGTEFGVAAVLGYMTIYLVTTAGTFLCMLQIQDAEGRHGEAISAFAGLSRTRPGLAAAMAIFMFSFAGIPPLFGFWAKYMVFDAAIRAGQLPLALIGIALSVISAFYYLRIVRTMYFDPPAEGIAPARNPAEDMTIAICAVSLLVGLLFIPGLDAWTLDAARALFP